MTIPRRGCAFSSLALATAAVLAVLGEKLVFDMDQNRQQRQLPNGRVNGTNGNGRHDALSLGEPAANPIRDSFRTLWKFRRRSIVFFFVVMAIVVAGLMVCPRKYTSDARLFVRIGRESVTLDPTVTTGQIMGVETSRETEINSLLEEVRSRRIVELDHWGHPLRR